MRKFALLFAFVVVLGTPVTQAESVGKEIMVKIARKGLEKVQEKLDEKDAQKKGENATEDTDKKNANEVEKMQEEEPLPVTRKGFSRLMLNTLSYALENVKEQYKEEGLNYVRHAGDLLAERITQNKKVESTIFTVKIMAWFIVCYLTIVTALLIWMLKRLILSNKRIMELMEKSSTVDSQPGQKQ